MPKQSLSQYPVLTFLFKSQPLFPIIQAMKSKASKFLKNLFSAIVTLVKTKSIAVKTKAAGLKSTRLLLVGLLNNKRMLMTTISHKMNVLLSNERDQQRGGTSTRTGTSFEAYEGTMVRRKSQKDLTSTPDCFEDMDLGYFQEGDDEYPDLTHSLLNSDDEEEEEENPELASSSSTDLVKSSRKDASSFNLEDEIDLVADVFIRRVLKQRRLQKQDSFKRSQEMNAEN